MAHTIREELLLRVEADYQKFAASLIPNISNVMGVRLPELRKLAAEIVKGDWRAYLAKADDEFFEEVMLQGMVIGLVKTDMEELQRYIAAFVPKIDNWSVCDSFCAGLKVTKKYSQVIWDFIQPYFGSEQEYDLRFAAVMLLNFYVNEEYIERVLQRLDQIDHPAYYVKMAVAWAVSICYIKQPEPTMAYLKNNALDTFTYNKALQKITESYRIDPDTKAIIRSMKRKVVKS